MARMMFAHSLRMTGLLGLVAASVALAQDPLSSEQERALPPKSIFKECAGCPEMVVVAAGEFMMGSPDNEKDRFSNEGPRHRVRIATAFAVSRYPITSEQWHACVDQRGCRRWEKNTGAHPALYVRWDGAKQYAAWLSKQTGKPYRLLTEAEFEYAARAGSDKAYPWGDDIGKGNANCQGCGSPPWENANPDAGFKGETAPVGSFPPNAFGLYDMQGNAWQFVEDCYHHGYESAPADGSAWTTGCADDTSRVIRGGSYTAGPEHLRSASRSWITTGAWNGFIGFRIARTLAR